jgi:hypothetical protein
VRDLVHDVGGAQVGTVGSIRLMPNLINVIPREAVVTVDLRNVNDARLAEAERRLDAFLHQLGATDKLEIRTRRLARFEPVVFDSGVVRIIEAAAASLGQPIRRMTSGAGQDAQMLARLCPTAMIFVPSIGGISHSPEERTAPEHLELGANVLLRTQGSQDRRLRLAPRLGRDWLPGGRHCDAARDLVAFVVLAQLHDLEAKRILATLYAVAVLLHDRPAVLSVAQEVDLHVDRAEQAGVSPGAVLGVLAEVVHQDYGRAGFLGDAIGGGSRAIFLLCYVYDALPFEVPPPDIRAERIVSAARNATAKGVEHWQANFVIDAEGISLISYFKLRLF